MSTVWVAAVRPPTYPARPLNGGPLALAPTKPGQWYYEPKYNGWLNLPLYIPPRRVILTLCLARSANIFVSRAALSTWGRGRNNFLPGAVTRK